MASIDDLLNFINSNIDADWSKDKWQINLTRAVPNWRDILQDPDNLSYIDQLQCHTWNLCDFLLDTVGIGLAKRWFRSNVDDQVYRARIRLRDVAKLNSDIWNSLEDIDIKEYIIMYTFDDHPGEPFRSMPLWLREYPIHKDIRFSVPVFPVIRYVPSGQIYKLRSIVEKAGDDRSLALIDRMIADRKEACRLYVSPQAGSLRSPYTLTRDERELVAHMMDEMRSAGFHPAALPDIFLTLEAPPLFVSSPELEDEDEERQSPRDAKSRVPRNRQRRGPDTISIEEVLGCYMPNPKIILYLRGLRWLARRRGFDEEMLRAVVLIHELGHWVTHLLRKPGCPEWPLELYKLTEEDVHEGWAQLITWWIAEKVGGDFKKTFEDLNKGQSAPYRVFERFINYKPIFVLASLERLRLLSWPARLKDWESFIFSKSTGTV